MPSFIVNHEKVTVSGFRGEAKQTKHAPLVLHINLKTPTLTGQN